MIAVNKLALKLEPLSRQQLTNDLAPTPWKLVNMVLHVPSKGTYLDVLRLTLWVVSTSLLVPFCGCPLASECGLMQIDPPSQWDQLSLGPT